jgi:hypothetical protein
MALFKYVVAESPTNKEDFVKDVVKILGGERDLANLSANCNGPLSGHVSASREVTAGRELSIVVNDNVKAILKRKHSKFATKDIFIDVYANADNYLRLGVLGGFEDGQKVNPNEHADSTSTAYMQYMKYLTPLKVFYIGLTDTTAFVTDDEGTHSVIHSELWELTSDNGLFSYAGASADCTFAMDIMNASYTGAINMPKGSGDILNDSMVERPDYLITDDQSLTTTFKSTAGVSVSLTGNDYPVPLGGGRFGFPLYKSFCQPVEGTYTPAQYTMADVYMSPVTSVNTLMGKSINDSLLGDLLVITIGTSVAGGSYYTFYIPGV